MKILVTGATGFVGRHVINELLKYDHEIIAAVRNKHSVKTFPDKVKLIELDLTNLRDKNYYLAFDQPDILIHLAWEGLPNYKDQLHLSNLPSHAGFLDNIIFYGLQNVVVT
ncbi:MAG TPA: NAD-dependent epimerase/dehydratase family protein, partial [Chitinophagaceae bacterium]|nr:NAD-dependent epimerase/dehydratase family protein [Chitinophagaceae bacterium]